MRTIYVEPGSLWRAKEARMNGKMVTVEDVWLDDDIPGRKEVRVRVMGDNGRRSEMEMDNLTRRYDKVADPPAISGIELVPLTRSEHQDVMSLAWDAAHLREIDKALECKPKSYRERELLVRRAMQMAKKWLKAREHLARLAGPDSRAYDEDWLAEVRRLLVDTL